MSELKFLLARKKGMTQIFREDGSVIPVTVLEAGPCTVTGLRNDDLDGYQAVQVGFIPAREKHVHKPQKVAAEKAGVKPFRVLKEFRTGVEAYEVGQELKADLFEIGDIVDVVGTSKGRGFAGTIKRHGFSRGNETHGCMNVRRPGAIGQCAYPGRVFKGTRMSGHYGAKKITVKNLVVEAVDSDRGLVLVRGGVPGPPNGLLQIKTAITGTK
ncbi:MAG TPA: 50S ribosomal protein L3 [Planctomycetota bacterium]|jgi:large subunit ribosomal protein L3|nr:50S ribosomal protein L3 [Planctomycetota bacterium]MDP6128288.1 50S ribosomal protein L3 [Planctomycetota bacterium]MDP7246021.1 50S ribosomal protein L3 [Planctomycetota bacterium]HJM38967.1 50S ribosomal protein L3 [Planctomycetota bacterium]|tara:strand:+ start:47812 stop:48450 length:639 start_codon:yes stop_codon:yes gene_type:complete